MSGDKGGGGHHGLERAFGLVLAAIIAFSWGVAALQAAVAEVTPTVRSATNWLEAHGVLIAVVAVAFVIGYVWLRLKLRPVRSPQRWPGEQPPVYQFDGRVDRGGVLGAIGRRLATRAGGPVVVRGGRPVHVHRAEVEDDLDDDGDQVDDEDEAPEADEPAYRHSPLEARAIFLQAMRSRRR